MHPIPNTDIPASAGAGDLVTELSWLPAQSYSIQRKFGRRVWHSGRVDALLSNGTFVVAGTPGGGVWLLNPAVQPSYRDGDRGSPLSDNWDTQSICSLAWGPDADTQVFVGTADGFGVILLELEQLVGEVALERTTSIPGPFAGPVYGIALLADSPGGVLSTFRVAIAATDGVWWSPIPADIRNAAAYAWRLAEGLPEGTYVSMAAAGWSGDSRLARSHQNLAVAGYGPYPAGKPLFHPLHVPIIFIGVWKDDSTLVFSPAQIDGVNSADMWRTSIASCADSPSNLYAVATAAPDGFVSAVLRSTDGGGHWQALAQQPDRILAGGGGDYEQPAIAVSPYHPNVLAVGFRTGGPFYSNDSGASWQQPRSDGGKGASKADDSLHADTRTLHFARAPFEQDVLYIGSDGGIVYSSDLGQTNSSQFNRPLHNLQMYGSSTTASSRFPGLLIAGTQDNGNLFLAPKQEAGQAWQALDDGDGGVCRFVDVIAAVLRLSSYHSADEDESKVRLAFWDDATQQFGAPTVVPADGDSAGLSLPSSLEVVAEPSWVTIRSLGGNLTPGTLVPGMLSACAAAAGGDGRVYGFYAAVDGSHAQFLKIASVGAAVTSLASLDGSVICAGTGDGRIFSIVTSSGSVTEISLQGFYDDATTVLRLQCVQIHSRRVAPSLGPQLYALYGSNILLFDGRRWTAVPGSGWATFAVDEDSGRLFAASGSVYLFSEADQRWISVSQGLPAVSASSDLRITNSAGGGRDLYFATYGRSVWRANITRSPSKGAIHDLPPRAAQILQRIIEDGGGMFRIGEQFIALPASRLARDVLAALAIEHISSSMTTESRTAMRRAVLEAIVTAARREIS